MTIRQADRDDVYNGIKIRAGTLVFIPTLVSNSDPLAWGEDADQFNPNRWDSLPPANSNYSFMTFIQGILSHDVSNDRSAKLYWKEIRRDRDEMSFGSLNCDV